MNTRLIGALLCAIFAASLAAQPQVYTLDVDAPSAGHFWAVGPLPIDAPPVLVGLKGARAYRLETLGDHSAIYGFESMGELMDGGPVTMVKAEDTDGVPRWWPHPAVMDDLTELQGKVSIDGHATKSVAMTHEQKGEFRQRFKAVHDCGPYVAVFWADVYARSPVVQVSGFVAARDRDTHRDIKVEVGFGEPIAFPESRLHGGRLDLHRGAIAGQIDLDRGAIYPLRLTLLCAYAPPPQFGPEPPSSLDELTKAAILAGSDGPRWFSPTAWDREWLGVVPTVGTGFGRRLAQGAQETFQQPHGMTDMRPWASAPNANQGGAQNGLGASWWLPALVPTEFQPHAVHLWCAQDWMLRPVHVAVPDPVALPLPRASTVGRQVYDAVPEMPAAIRYRTRGEIPVHLSNGNTDWRTPHDEQHMADMPLLAAYALTGDPVVAWTIDSLRAVDLAQRRPIAGWRNGPRGEGRTASSMLMAARLRDADVLAAVEAHLLGRLNTANRLSSTAGLPVEAPGRPLHLQTDPRIYCQKPASVPYEEATLAWSSWLLWRSTGDQAALESAYRYGLAVAVNLYQDGDEWRVPYAVFHDPAGGALTDAQLHDPTYVHASTWPIWWAGEGLRALVASASLLEVPDEHAQFVERAQLAIEWLDRQPAPSVDEAHHALHGTAVPVAVVEGAR